MPGGDVSDRRGFVLWGREPHLQWSYVCYCVWSCCSRIISRARYCWAPVVCAWLSICGLGETIAVHRCELCGHALGVEMVVGLAGCGGTCVIEEEGEDGRL